MRLIPLPCNGSVPNSGTYARFRYGLRPTPPLRVLTFNSEGHSTSALPPGLHHVLLGSLKIALKHTRPRQRFRYDIGRYSMREGEIRQEAFTGSCCFIIAASST
jgi:hypothetical protein